MAALQVTAAGEYPQVKLDLDRELPEIHAVWNKEIRGEYYDGDDETWASVADLAVWRTGATILAALSGGQLHGPG